AALAPKGWLHARLTVPEPDAQGFGLAGSGVFVLHPPHTLRAALAEVLPYLVDVLGRYDAASFVLDDVAPWRALNAAPTPRRRASARASRSSRSAPTRSSSSGCRGRCPRRGRSTRTCRPTGRRCPSRCGAA